MDLDSRCRVIVAITGASGAVYGVRMLLLLQPLKHIEVHLVVSSAAKRTIATETSYSLTEIKALAEYCYHNDNLGAAIASGSFQTLGMIVAPCSIKSLSCIATSNDADLVTRAADVCMKERRRVVLMLRETPFHAGHIELMAAATRNGAIIMPPVPAFYNQPQSITDLVDHSCGRALDLLGIDVGTVKRWGDPPL